MAEISFFPKCFTIIPVFCQLRTSHILINYITYLSPKLQVISFFQNNK